MKSRLYFTFCWILLMVLTALFAWRPLSGGVDFWAHAAIGRWIVQHHAIPHQTLFLWSGTFPWVAHSWLSQLFFYGLIHSGGPVLVLLFCVLANCLMFSLIWWLWLRHGNLDALAPAIFAFGIWCAQARFNPRPELFSAFFVVVMLTALSLRAQKYFSPRRLWWFVPLFILWANLHGGMAMGLVLLTVTVILETAQRYFQKQPVRPALGLAILFAACAAVTLINPFGWHYWHAITQVDGPLFAMIDEWKSPFIAPALPPLAILSPFILCAAALFCWLGNARKQWAQLGWLLLAIVMFASARRNLEFISLVSLIVIAANDQLLRTSLNGILKTWAPRLAAVYVAIFTLSIALPKTFSPLAQELPRGVANAVLREQKVNPNLRIFNDYLNSSYFQWRFAGHPLLYIDLLNAYPAELLQKYFSIIHADADGLEQFQKLHVDLVAFGPYTKESRQYPLAQYLNNSPWWKRIYQEDDGSVWVKQKKYFPCPRRRPVSRKLSNHINAVQLCAIS